MIILACTLVEKEIVTNVSACPAHSSLTIMPGSSSNLSSKKKLPKVLQQQIAE